NRTGFALGLHSGNLEGAGEDDVERGPRVGFADNHRTARYFMDLPRSGQALRLLGIEDAQQGDATQHLGQVDLPLDTPRRNLCDRDIALRIGWDEPRLIEKSQSGDYHVARDRELFRIVADPEIQAVDDAPVVSFIDQHDRLRVRADARGSLPLRRAISAERVLPARCNRRRFLASVGNTAAVR